MYKKYDLKAGNARYVQLHEKDGDILQIRGLDSDELD